MYCKDKFIQKPSCFMPSPSRYTKKTRGLWVPVHSKNAFFNAKNKNALHRRYSNTQTADALVLRCTQSPSLLAFQNINILLLAVLRLLRGRNF